LETAGIKFVSQQQALPFVTADAASGSGTDAASGADLLVQVDPLREVIGPLELAVQYDHPVPSIAPGQEIELPLPLVRPPARDGVITAGISLQVKSSPNLRCSVSDEIWEPGLGAESPGNGQLTRTAARLPSEVALRVSRSDQPQQASTVVLQSWILTCLGSSLRHERAVFRVRTNQPEIGVQLPAGAQVERVGLDGRDVTAFAGGGGGKIAVALAPDPTASDHVLEVWYQTPSTRSWSWFRTIDLPQVAGATAIQQRYWTVATPPGLHLATGPSGWTPELVWRWQGWYWGRRARLRPDQLERWAGASVQPLPLADGENEYLLSRFGSDQTPLVCTVVSRGAVLGLVSGCVLVLGLLAMYSSLGRHPAVLFVGGLGLLWLMLWQPDVALVVA
jgi:hypothetical protein